jgi:hypothetical protein
MSPSAAKAGLLSEAFNAALKRCSTQDEALRGAEALLFHGTPCIREFVSEP